MSKSREREFLQLLHKHETSLVACVHALVPHWNDAEDVLQETKIALWEQFERFESGSDFAAWARTVARYKVRAYYAQPVRHAVQFSDDILANIDGELDRLSGTTDARVAALVYCVQRLNRKHQLLLHQRYVEGKKLLQIAESLGRALSGLYSTYSRIHQFLQKCVTRRLRGEEN